jgi:hypothetical protein
VFQQEALVEREWQFDDLQEQDEEDGISGDRSGLFEAQTDQGPDDGGFLSQSDACAGEQQEEEENPGSGGAEDLSPSL